jgi:hypothetical protein
MKAITVLTIAEVCYAANQAFRKAIGEPPLPNWDEVSPDIRNSYLHGVRFHIQTLVKGKSASGEAAHKAWMESKIADGWTYAEEYDPEKKTHPNLQSHDALSREQHVKDHLFAGIVESLWVNARNSQGDTMEPVSEAPSPEVATVTEDESSSGADETEEHSSGKRGRRRSA